MGHTYRIITDTVEVISKGRKGRLLNTLKSTTFTKFARITYT
jgi:hypothetical protein